MKKNPAVIADQKPPLTDLQKIVFSLYEQFKVICEAEDLRYFAISGTTLGAVLWNGIIPWDDDIDIAMPTKDYRKFIKIYKKYLPDNIRFSEYTWFGGKLHDINTTSTNIYYINQPDRYNGVFLDIVPLIALPDDQAKRVDFIERLITLREEGYYKEAYSVGGKTISKIGQEAYKIMSEYDFDTAKYVMDFSDPRYTLSSKGFLHPSEVEFETSTIFLSSNYEEDLKIQYGKYEKYPPKINRESAHNSLSIVNTDKPCGYYAKEYNKINPEIRHLLDVRRKYDGELILQKLNLAKQVDSLSRSLEDQRQLVKDLRSELETHKSIKRSIQLLIRNIERKISSKESS